MLFSAMQIVINFCCCPFFYHDATAGRIAPFRRGISGLINEMIVLKKRMLFNNRIFP